MNRLDMTLQGISEEAMLADGFDDCVVGVCDKTGRAVYDADAMVDKLMEENGWDWLEAREYYDKAVSTCKPCSRQ